MLKALFCLRCVDKKQREEWHESLRELAMRNSQTILRLEVCCADKHVNAAHLLEMTFTEHPKDALVTAWANSLDEFDALSDSLHGFGECQSYMVAESNVIATPSAPGRVEGWCQVAFLKKPETLSHAQWLNIWLGSHTQIAIDTQSTFGYRQNIVVGALPLSDEAMDKQWPLMDAIVEENFPTEAMQSREVFFDAEGDPEKFERHQQIMMESSFRFIDFENFDCVPMSQYVLKSN